MPVNQSTYVENPADAVVGLVATGATFDASAYIVDDTDGIAFGLAVQIGGSYERCKLGTGPNKHLGLTIKDVSLGMENDDKYPEDYAATVCYRGDVWVKVEGAVTVGGAVYAENTDGVLSEAPQGASLINGAVAAAATTINVDTGSQFAAGDILTIENEQVSVTSRSGAALTVVRGVNGTDGAAHADNSVITSGTRISGARWVRAAADEGLSIIRLGGNQASA